MYIQLEIMHMPSKQVETIYAMFPERQPQPAVSDSAPAVDTSCYWPLDEECLSFIIGQTSTNRSAHTTHDKTDKISDIDE